MLPQAGRPRYSLGPIAFCRPAIRRLYRHLCGAMDGAGMPHPDLPAFGRHLHEYLLIPSGRGGGHGGARLASAPGGCFTYEPPPGVVWSAECGVRSAECAVGGAADTNGARLTQAQQLPHE